MAESFETTDRLQAPLALDFEKGGGLLPAVIQHWQTHQVLMVGFMNRAALIETLESHEVVFFSRTRQRRWKKGETSGHRLEVKGIRTDCDRDVILVRAEPLGPVCHLGTSSCFDGDAKLLLRDYSRETTARTAQSDPDRAPHPTAHSTSGVLEELVRLVHSRVGESPDTSYTARLLKAGPPRVGQKLGEEGVELAIAAQSDDRAAIADEAADLLFHLAVLLECKGVSLDEVAGVLASRRGKSGLRPAN